MTKIELEKLFKELKELQRMEEELKAEITSIQDQIKLEMVMQGKDELTTNEYKARWNVVKSNKFDLSAFKEKHIDLYNQYLKQTTTKRFTVA